MTLKLRTLVSALVLAGPAYAQAPAPRIILGYRCMMLNITEQQSMDPSFHVVLRSAPSATAPTAGWATAVVIVQDRSDPKNGFLPMLRANGQTAWIAADEVKPYKPVASPNVLCVPEVLPNGRIGIGPG